MADADDAYVDLDLFADLTSVHNAHTTAWLSTTASQIFFMQLGFLCYEVGFVKKVWTQSVILKNIEDTFVGVLIYLSFGHTLSASKDSFHGIISIPKNPFLIGLDAQYHDQILISAFFASTCATIISGSILERMKNKAYIAWCLMIILVNYSFVSHWVWHNDGWLNKLGFVDGAGAVVVHSTAGMGALIAVWKLGPRRDATDADGNLLPTEHAAKPIINAIGAFFLWYGWFAFNVSSPIAFSRGIGHAVGTTALVTVISPISSSCCAFILMHWGFVKLSFESLLNCLLAGLVSITCACHTADPGWAVLVGSLGAITYFLCAKFVRYKLHIDDPLQVVAIHLCCGIYAGIIEGVIANDTYGTPGLVHGGFRHFGVQVLGVVVIVVFNFLVSLTLYEGMMKRVLFRNIRIRVSILDIYLGIRLFDQNYDMALDEVLNCSSSVSKQMLWEFHKFLEDRYASEQLNFLIVSKIYSVFLEKNALSEKPDKFASARYILRIMHTYIDENGDECINVSGKQRSILKRITKQLLVEIKHKRDSENEEKAKKEERKEEEAEAVEAAAGKTDTNLDVKAATPLVQKRNRDGSPGFLTAFDGGLSQSGLDIATENVFKGVYDAVWKLVIPHFAHFLQNSYNIEKVPKFVTKIPFQLDKNWVIEWDQQLKKEEEQINLADAVPKYNTSSTLLSKLLKEYDGNHGYARTSLVETEDNKRSSLALEQITLTPGGGEMQGDKKGAIAVVIE